METVGEERNLEEPENAQAVTSSSVSLITVILLADV